LSVQKGAINIDVLGKIPLGGALRLRRELSRTLAEMD